MLMDMITSVATIAGDYGLIPPYHDPDNGPLVNAKSSKAMSEKTTDKKCTVALQLQITVEELELYRQNSAGFYNAIDSITSGVAHLAAGLCCGLSGLAAGMAIGIVGDADVRALGFKGWSEEEGVGPSASWTFTVTPTKGGHLNCDKAVQDLNHAVTKGALDTLEGAPFFGFMGVTSALVFANIG